MNEHNKLEELSFILPFLGIFLFSPALFAVFDIPVTIFGVPFLHVYLFSTWFVLLIVSFILTRRLADTTTTQSNEQLRSSELQAHLDKITKP